MLLDRFYNEVSKFCRLWKIGIIRQPVILKNLDINIVDFYIKYVIAHAAIINLMVILWSARTYRVIKTDNWTDIL